MFFVSLFTFYFGEISPEAISQDTPAVNGFTFPYGKVLSAYVSSIEPFIPDYLTLSFQPESKLRRQIESMSPIRKSPPLASQCRH